MNSPHRLLGLDDGEEDFDAADVLEDETVVLQEIVDSMLVIADTIEETDVNRILTRVADACLQATAQPIVLRQNLQPDLPPVAAPAAMVSWSLERALRLQVAAAAAGDELALATQLQGERVVVAIASSRHEDPEALALHTETLREFVDEFGGSCRLEEDGQCIRLEFPLLLTTDDA